jgi:hypothetical protein
MKKLNTVLVCLLTTFQLSAQTLTSSNLPVIIINTHDQVILDDPKIEADMGIIYNGNGIRNNVTDAFNHYNGKIGIEIRGHASQQFPMKSYGIELRDASGNSQDKSLFGLPKESDWVLYAPYTDKTLMRNFLTYTMAREMGHWAANCRFVEVVINGDYRGIYVFMEKIKRGSGRVNISKMATTDITGDAVTGGYIFSLDKDATGWFSSYGTPNAADKRLQFDYVYPKSENIVAEQKAYLKSYVDSFENALASPQFQDKINGVRKFADIASFIDFFIVNEVGRNIDGYRLSSFFYKDRNSKNNKIFAGPVWDFDLAFRNVNYCNGNDTTGWSYKFNYVCSNDYWLVPFWWDRLMTDTAFQSDLRCRWKGLRQTNLSVNHFNHLIDSIVDFTAEARTRHFQKWPVLGQYVWPNPQPIPANYAEEISTLKTWIEARLQWIDKNIPNTGGCYDYPQDQEKSIVTSVSPNPVNGNGTLRVLSKNDQVLSVQICDASGRILQADEVHLQKGNNTITLKMYSWAKGIYFVSLQTSGGYKELIKLLHH